MMLCACILIPQYKPGQASGKHFVSVSVQPRERDAIAIGYVSYLIFGIVHDVCTGDVPCGIFVLAFQVVNILIVPPLAFHETTARVSSPWLSL